MVSLFSAYFSLICVWFFFSPHFLFWLGWVEVFWFVSQIKIRANLGVFPCFLLLVFLLFPLTINSGVFRVDR